MVWSLDSNRKKTNDALLRDTRMENGNKTLGVIKNDCK